MTLSWNEIKERAVAFSKEWQGAINEEADAKTFLGDFFEIFGVNRKRVGTFEHRVRKLDDSNGFIDMLWKGVILIEMKSRGRNLSRAHEQAKTYIHGLKDHELPKFILVCDFYFFSLYDLESGEEHSFILPELNKNVHHFGPIAGYQKRIYKEQDPVNIQAALKMGRLHDSLKETGYIGHNLEVYLVRILFCLFADSTTIFELQQFQAYIDQRTHEDGSDVGAKLHELFQVLNTPSDKRFKNIDEQLNDFPYINGRLFEEKLDLPSFNSSMRLALLECCYLDWSKISPAIFGSMFQSVMNSEERRSLGAHYTSEVNILKLIKPLFLDSLRKEFEAVKSNKRELALFHKSLSTLKFLDPACGCGNFLIVTYRELRKLELDILRVTYGNQRSRDIGSIVWLDVDMMYGIEYEEFPARIAEVALWLIDHQMNMEIQVEFGEYFARLPLKKSATIIHGDALKLKWSSIISSNDLSYMLGNPPFIGHHMQTKSQKDGLLEVIGQIKAAGVLDYVTGWFYKTCQFIHGTNIKAAFVSTNSITQGEQVGILWRALVSNFGVKIHFAHRTFKWKNEAKGNASVYCVIIGFGCFDIERKIIFDYNDLKGEAYELRASNINPYLIDGKDISIENRSKPICLVPAMRYGSKPTDGGNFLLTDEEKQQLVIKEPQSERFIRPFISARTYITGEKRWCIWLKNAEPKMLSECKEILKRVNKVKLFREKSKAEITRTFLSHTLFRQITQPEKDYLVVPRTTSENRKYIPLSFFSTYDIVSDTCQSIPGANMFHFGILSSEMHMVWVKTVCGRLKSDYRYSKDIVYNNFPWPANLTKHQEEKIQACANEVLEARQAFPESSLADLYNPLTMPEQLLRAHQLLDRAVDLAYRPQAFSSDAKRLEYLFDLYEKYTADLFFQPKTKAKPNISMKH